MDFSFGEISVEDIRKQCILKYLKDAQHEAEPGPTHIYITGKTRAGKTTFENLVIGHKAFSQSGRKDSTETVQLIEFKNGLSFFDLPGIEGNQVRLENINRICLGLPEISPAPGDKAIDKIEVNFAALDSDHTIPRTYDLTDYQQNTRFKPHLVFYIIGSRYTIINSEERYIQDMMERHQVIFIINEFENTEIRNDCFDIENKLKDIRSRSQTSQKLMICPMDCRNGRGLEKLFQATENVLGKVRGESVSRMLWYQFQRTPDIIRKELGARVMDAAQWLSSQRPAVKPEDDPVLSLLAVDLFRLMNGLRQHLSQLPDDSTPVFPEAPFQSLFKEMDDSCRYEREEQRTREEPYEYNGVTSNKILNYTEKVIDYNPYTLNSAIRLIALLLLSNELTANRALDETDLRALQTGLEVRKNIIPADSLRLDGLQRYSYRLFHQFFGPMLNKTVVGDRTGDIEDYVGEFIASPYIFHFKTADHFLVTSQGTHLWWRTENARACFLLHGPDKQQVPANEDRLEITLLEDATLSLQAENGTSSRKTTLRIRVYQPAAIKLMDLSSLNFRVDPVSFRNPSFDLSTLIIPGGNVRNSVGLRLETLKSRRVQIEPDLLDDLKIGDIAGYGRWDLNLQLKLKKIISYLPDHFNNLKKEIFRIFKTRT
jgi:predicted GTPase